MSEATERPAPDADAWADACAEDLAAEQERRRAQYGPEPGSAAEELRKLLGAVTDKFAGLFDGPSGLSGMAAQGAVQQLISQAKAAVEPVIERNPEVFDHLAAAGGELLAAYRSAVEGHEKRWTSDAGRTGPGGKGTGPDGTGRDGDQGPGPTEHIDLD